MEAALQKRTKAQECVQCFAPPAEDLNPAGFVIVVGCNFCDADCYGLRGRLKLVHVVVLATTEIALCAFVTPQALRCHRERYLK